MTLFRFQKMLASDLCFSRTLNPNFRPFLLRPKTISLTLKPQLFHSTISCSRQNGFFSYSSSLSSKREIRAFAGRSKKKPGGPSPGRIEGNAELRRQIKRNAAKKSKKLAESLFYRLKNTQNKNHPDNFTEQELQLFGLGYERMVRFMKKDDPNLKHPYDWYKYGEFGPYSWRGVVVGEPVRGGLTDECVSIYSETKDTEDMEKIEQFEMEVDFGERLKQMDENVGFRHYWVFVRHPRWRLNEHPWQQWTLVSEVVVEAGKKQRLDKWNLMARLGNKARRLITQCSAWFRPDIIYVKRPVYQSRFEPQEEFLSGLIPYLDPRTENDFVFEVRSEDGESVEWCTYYEGLCKIVKVNSRRAFVDDVVNAYEKLSDENKSRCLEFLLLNHPVQLLHPYTKEWKLKLEEMELGCDAPDDAEDEWDCNKSEQPEFAEWIEDDGDGGDDDKEDGDEDNMVMEMAGGGIDDGVGDVSSADDELANEEEGEEEDEEEDEKYWDEKLRKEVSSADAMENLVRDSIERTSKLYKKQLKAIIEDQGKGTTGEDGDETAMRGKRVKVSPQEWKIAGIGRWGKRIRKSKIPPELFLRAAVRPFTYRNLVKEIVLTRHAIVDGDIGSKE